MIDYIAQLQKCVDHKLYSAAVIGIIIIPDICGAVEYPKENNGIRFRKWCTDFGFEKSSDIPSAILWKIRNGLIHNARMNFSGAGFDRIMFTIEEEMAKRGGMMLVHNCIYEKGGIKFLQFDIRKFHIHMISALKSWLKTVDFNSKKGRDLLDMIQYREDVMDIFGMGFAGIM